LLSIGLAFAALAPWTKWDLVGEGFLVYLADHLKDDGTPLKQRTIASYMTHATALLKYHGLIHSTDLFYSRLPDIMKGLCKRDIIFFGPPRLRLRVSITLPIIKLIVAIAYQMFPHHIAWFIDAAIHVGYFFGLRPGDYIVLDGPQNGHRTMGYQLYFVFGNVKNDPISLADRHLFPPGARPILAIITSDTSKACQFAGAPMRGLARHADNSPGTFQGIDHLFDFFTDNNNYPGKSPNGLDLRLFGRFPTSHNLQTVTKMCFKAAARQLNLPPHLMHVVGVRPGMCEHLSNFSAADQDYAGGWNSNRYRKEAGGRAPYLRPTIAWAFRVTAALHNMEHTNISRWISTARAGPARDPPTRPHTLELAVSSPRPPRFQPRHRTID